MDRNLGKRGSNINWNCAPDRREGTKSQTHCSSSSEGMATETHAGGTLSVRELHTLK